LKNRKNLKNLIKTAKLASRPIKNLGGLSWWVNSPLSGAKLEFTKKRTKGGKNVPRQKRTPVGFVCNGKETRKGRIARRSGSTILGLPRQKEGIFSNP
jgi:hypothetical protein